YPDVKVIVHPECHEDVVNKADLVGSTEYIIRTITAAPAGTTWAVGTELNLVNRLKHEQTDKKVFFLSSTVCQCATMYRIDAPHLCWALENLVDGHVVNRIVVPDDEKQWAKVALDRMMALS
ncbi:MAG: quinolinate synthase, partial [Nitrospira sp. UW-LDO-02]